MNLGNHRQRDNSQALLVLALYLQILGTRPEFDPYENVLHF
jgi:hypothetical protein